LTSRADTWFVYLARCSDGSFYTGIARDVAERVRSHDAGKGARYTRGRGPLTVCATRLCRSKGTALRLELQVKQLTREQKAAIAEPAAFRAFAARRLR
jgi:putative endonuclease